MATNVTDALIMSVADSCNTYDGIRLAMQGFVRSWKATGGSVTGFVEEVGGDPDEPVEVWVGLVNGVLSYDCRDCYPPEPSFAIIDDEEVLIPRHRLCVHGAAVAYAAATSGAAWSESPTCKSLADIR